ncbi:MAG: FkbM family methyltransferase [Rhodobacter sp.]|nr:FkbM family methyltransferase [Rhodobacter sp.]
MTPEDKISKARALLAAAYTKLNAALPHESGRKRGAIAQECWRLRLMGGEHRRYFSQSGQDWFVDQVILKKRRGGVFVDVGGFDGVTGSNTLFFEIFRGWSGLLIEAVSAELEYARNVRRCACVGAVVSGDGAPSEFLEVTGGYRQMSGRIDTYDETLLDRMRTHPDHQERILRVETRTLAEILREQGIGRIDYLSLDIEGAELDVLSTFPFDTVDVDVFSIENAAARPEIHALLTARGFRLAEFLGVDEIYCRADLLDTS